MRILAIDDDPFILKLLQRQLEALGQDVMTCPSATQALGQLTTGQNHVELLFCDIQMPGMDGVELIRHLAGSKFAGGLVLLSGQDERIMQSVCQLARAHGLDVRGALRKPVSRERLQTILSRPATQSGSRPRARRACYPAQVLREAMQRGELVNHYQPKVSLRTGAWIGVEALVRWQHLQDGLVFPDQFIPSAENSGLIDDLTRTVLELALDQAGDWQQQGLHLSVAVNISMSNLNSVEFPDTIVRLAQQRGLDLSRIALEVTESQLMQNPETALDILTRMRLKNISLSIDDFGTGHSSLRQLYEIPFNELKVDAGFVHGAHRDRTRQVILETSLAMAKRLGMGTVAEGVEDLDDWRFLAAQGHCDLAQGYFIGRPMPAAQLLHWQAEWAERCRELI